MSRVQWSCRLCAVQGEMKEKTGTQGISHHGISPQETRPWRKETCRAVSLYGTQRLNSCVLLQVSIEVALKGQGS